MSNRGTLLSCIWVTVVFVAVAAQKHAAADEAAASNDIDSILNQLPTQLAASIAEPATGVNQVGAAKVATTTVSGEKEPTTTVVNTSSSGAKKVTAIGPEKNAVAQVAISPPGSSEPAVVSVGGASGSSSSGQVATNGGNGVAVVAPTGDAAATAVGGGGGGSAAASAEGGVAVAATPPSKPLSIASSGATAAATIEQAAAAAAIPVGISASAILPEPAQSPQQLAEKQAIADLHKTEAFALGWLSPLSCEEFKKSSLYVPLWNESQTMIPLEKRASLMPTVIDTFRMMRAVVEDSHNSMKFLFSAKVIAYYTPRCASLMFRHKIMERRLGIEHGYQFYKMLVDLVRDIILKSKTIFYSRADVSLPELHRRQLQAIEFLENIIKQSPVVENLDWRKVRLQNGIDALQEGADILAQMRAAGHNAIISLIESIVTLLSKFATKELTQNFDDLPVALDSTSQSSANGNAILSTLV